MTQNNFVQTHALSVADDTSYVTMTSSPSSSVASVPPPPVLYRTGGTLPANSPNGQPIPFSGGGLHNKPQTPRTTNCLRPTHTDLKVQQSIEKACTSPLDEAFRLELNPTQKGPTFTAWLNDVYRHFINHGLDTVAYVLKPSGIGNLDIYDPDLTTEHFLFKEWGQVSKVEIIAFNTAMLASICPLDMVNNRMACEFLRGSVSLELKRIIDQDLDVDCSAAYMLWTIINKVQGVNSTAGRDILKTIEGMRLSKESGYNVESFSVKLHTACKSLTGLGAMHVPADFSILISACFDATQIQQFDLEMATIANALDKDIQAHTWESIIDQAKTKYHVMKNTNRWPAATSSKAAASGFAVQLKDLTSKISTLESKLGTSSNSKSSSGTPDYSKDKVCRYCKSADHKVDTCPKLAAKNNKTPGSTNKTQSQDGKTKHWTKVAPATGKPEVQQICTNGTCVDWKWCSTCKRWRTGTKAHTTSEHIKRSSNSSPSSSGARANVAQAQVDSETYPVGLWAFSLPDVNFDGYEAASETASDDFLQDPMELDSSIEYPPSESSDSESESSDSSDSSFLLDSDMDESSDDSIKEYFYSVYDDPFYFDQQPNYFNKNDYPNAAFIPQWGTPEDFDDHGEFIGTQAELPWWHPKGPADYAIFNYLFLQQIPDPDTGIVHELEEKSEISIQETVQPDAWAELMARVETEFPHEFEGPRPPSYFFEWHVYGRPEAVTYDDAIPATMEDYPELVDDKHPKEVPRCI